MMKLCFVACKQGHSRKQDLLKASSERFLNKPGLCWHKINQIERARSESLEGSKNLYKLHFLVIFIKCLSFGDKEIHLLVTLEHSLNDQLSLFCFFLYQKGGCLNRKIEQITEREPINQIGERDPSCFQLVLNCRPG